MSEPIKVGDLVIILRACCDNSSVGEIHAVKAISQRGSKCMRCRTSHAGPNAVFANDSGTHTHDWGRPLAWLKRIPPFPELMDEKHEEDLREPVTS